MVMAPAPKTVGREFVRQYYTVLNMAPQCLHRFYNSNSSFIHGDDKNSGETITGQTQIHRYIKNLQLTDCRTKILLIDSQATLENGIVIQVSGELSSNGKPMRRFMQTFVLVPQEENKYYVRNDIFRYQDQVWEDNEETQTEEAEQTQHEDPVTEEYQTQDALDMQHDNTSSPDYSGFEQCEPTVPHMNGGHVYQEVPTHTESLSEQVESQHYEEPAPVCSPEPQQMPEPEPVCAPRVPSPHASPVCEPAPAPAPTPAPAPVKAPEPATPSAPRSYAGMIKSSLHPAPAPEPQQPQHAPAPQHTNGVPQDAPRDQRTAGRRGAANGYRAPAPSRGEEGAEDDWRQEGAMAPPRRREIHPDAHQIFVGNLPLNMYEEDLRALFEKYGSIVDLKINMGKSKMGGPKGASSNTPNFGFVTFSDEDAVRKCLQDKPITVGADHRLNVEEKKTRPRMEGGMGRGGMRPMGGRGGYGRMDGGRGRYGPPRR